MTILSKTFILSSLLVLSFLFFALFSIELSSARESSTCRNIHRQYDSASREEHRAELKFHKGYQKTVAEYNRARRNLIRALAKVRRIEEKGNHYGCDVYSWLP